MKPLFPQSQSPRMIAASILLAGFALITEYSHAIADVLGTANRIHWEPGVSVGVPGGIPNRGVIFTNLVGLDTTGATDVQPAVQAAVDACPSNQVVLLPPGTLRFNTPVRLKSHMTVRGAGMGSTVVRFLSSWGAAFQMGTGWSYQWNNPAPPNNRIISGFVKGSTNLVLASPVTAGHFCMVSELNDPTLPVLHTMGYERVRRQLTRVVNVQSGTNVTIWPPLVWTMQTPLLPSFAMGFMDIRFAGVENLTVDAANSSSATPIMSMEEAYGCWWLNVKVGMCPNRNFGVTDSTQCEMRGCWSNKSQGGATPNRAGLLVSQASSCLVENNIFDDVFPNIELWGGCSGNVFGYNFANSSYWGGSLNGNHAPHPQLNLWEGNVSANYQSDGYFGSASEDTLFRNWFHTEIPYGSTNSGIWAIKLNRFSRNAVILGNVLGTPRSQKTFFGLWNLGKPNIGNENWVGSGPPWRVQTRESGGVTYSQNGTAITTSASFFGSTNSGWFFQDRTTGAMLGALTYLSSTQASVTSSGSAANRLFAIAPGPSGWQELDTGVQTTAQIRGNFVFPTTTPVDVARVWPVSSPDVPLGTDTLPASLYLPSQPSWWGTNRWPAIDPLAASPVSPIPAQNRYYSNGSGSPQPSTPSGLRATN